MIINLWSKFYVNSLCSLKVEDGQIDPPSGVTGSINSLGGIGLKISIRPGLIVQILRYSSQQILETVCLLQPIQFQIFRMKDITDMQNLLSWINQGIMILLFLTFCVRLTNAMWIRNNVLSSRSIVITLFEAGWGDFVLHFIENLFSLEKLLSLQIVTLLLNVVL